MAWVIFKPDDRLVEAAVLSEVVATARVAALGGTTTSMEVDDGAGGNSLPDWFFPGCYVDTGGVLSADAPMPDVDRLQWAARGANDALKGLSRAADSLVGRLFSSAEGAPVHDWLVYSFHGLARVCRSAHWTIAQRVAFCGAMPGPVDVLAFYREVATAATTPTSAVLLADPDTGARVAPARAGAVTMGAEANLGADPPRADIVSGAWIDALVG